MSKFLCDFVFSHHAKIDKGTIKQIQAKRDVAFGV